MSLPGQPSPNPNPNPTSSLLRPRRANGSSEETTPLTRNATAKSRERLKRARVWNDARLSVPLHATAANYLSISVLAVLSVLLAVILGFPLGPLAGAWPSHGWIFFVPDTVLFLLGSVTLFLQLTTVLKVTAAISTSVLVLDLYSLAVNIYWIVAWVMGTLPAAAQTHQSMLQTGPLIIVLVVIVYFHTMAVTSLFGAISLIPDLKRVYLFDDE